MSMIKRGQTGKTHVEEFTQEENDKAIVCKACSRIVVSKLNLNKDQSCPHCHNNVNTVFAFSPILEDGEEDIAFPC